MKRSQLLAFAAAAVLLLFLWQLDVLAVFFGSSEDGGPLVENQLPPVKVITSPVEYVANDRTYQALGTGRAQQSVQVYPAVSEEVRSLHFEAGQRVSSGDLLVQLDDREEQLALQLARVQLKDAQSLLDRYERAVQDGAVPQSDVDSARASVSSAEVELQQAELAVEERKIRAPISGVVGIPQVDPGDRVDPSTLITGLDNRSTILVDFSVPELLSAALEAGQEVRAQTPAFGERTFPGEISALESRVDPATRTILARAEIDNGDDLLRPGMSFLTTLVIPGDTYARVPEIALQWGRDGSFVWSISDGVAQKMSATVVSRSAGAVLVESELSTESRVVVEGLQRLSPGRRVLDIGSSNRPSNAPATGSKR